MPKGMLIFDRETEETELRDALNGSRWKYILQDLEQSLKHYEGTPTQIREMLNQMVIDDGLELFD